MERHVAAKCLRHIRNVAGGAICAVALLSAVRPAFGQQVWLGPRGPDVKLHGAVDWSLLFKATPEWNEVAPKVQVLSITMGYILQASDEDLKAVAGDLASRHIAIALSMQSVSILSTDQCGHKSEGFGQPNLSARAAEKLNRVGMTLRYISLDEPLWFGHYNSGPEGCQFPVVELAHRVAQNVSAYLKYNKDIEVGDIEPAPLLTTFPDWKSSFRSFRDELGAIIHQKLAYLQTDVDWRVPHYDRALSEVADFAKTEGMRFGIFYKGDGLDRSAPDWVDAAVKHFEFLEGYAGLRPDIAVFATWDPHPTHLFPESSPGALTHVIERYVLPRSTIRALRTPGGEVSGRLVDEAGAPLSGATITLSRVGLLPGQAPQIQKVTGTVPEAARFAILGLRVNQECHCSGTNDLLVGPLRFQEERSGRPQVYDPSAKAESKSARFGGGVFSETVEAEDKPFVHFKVEKDQGFGFNSAPFAVDPGAGFTFEVPLSSRTGAGMFGSATLIWSDENHKGLSRTNIRLGRETAILARTRTDSNGAFRFSPSEAQGGSGGIQLEFDGDAWHRGTFQVLR